ncbi:LysR family transcriptional regulator [Aurantivibrio infirmus]
MDTQQLRAFVEVASTGSFSISAENLHLTQPAISKRISGLEEQLNQRLFDRIGRAVNLTEAGRVLLPRAQEILQTVNLAQQQLADLSGNVSGRFKLATSHHIGLHRLPPILQAFSERYPAVELDIAFLDSEKAHTQVVNGEIELAVITLSSDADATVTTKQIWHDELYFTVGAHHPLTRKKSPISLSELAQYPAILPEINTYTTKIVKQLFDQRGIALHTKLATNYLETIKMMVAINLGWSVLPKTMIDAETPGLNIPGVSFSRELGYIHHHNRSLSNAASAFIQLLERQ